MSLPALGPRGEGWVALQFALIGVLAVVGAALQPSAPWPGPVWVLRGIGAAVALLGMGLALHASRVLGRALTPLPAPTGDHVVRAGPYRIVRHPIYSGILLICTGFALITTPWTVPVVLALFLTWALKSRVEERMLSQRFIDYSDYCRAVRWRIIPGLY